MLIDCAVVNASPLICLFKSGLKVPFLTERVGKRVGENLPSNQLGYLILYGRERL
jgi:hypothetical protein